MLGPALSQSPSTVKYPCHLIDVFHESLENREIGAVVIDACGRAIFMNEAARLLLQSPDGEMPGWTRRYVRSLRVAVARQVTAIERWECGNLFLRVRARPLGRIAGAVLEVTVARSLDDRQVAGELSRTLNLQRRDAHLLELLWRGMSDDEIADDIGFLGKWRLRRRLQGLFRKLHVDIRPQAVLRAAQALAA